MPIATARTSTRTPTAAPIGTSCGRDARGPLASTAAPPRGHGAGHPHDHSHSHGHSHGIGLAIFISACVAGYEAIDRLVNPRDIDALGAVAIAGLLGFIGNWIAAGIRTRAGHQLDSPALPADGAHARADAYVSLAVILSAAVVAAGLRIADPLIGLGITLVILRITWDSWQTVRAGAHEH